jgi:hypothetical protein
VLWRNERGAAAVEFALILPIIVTILFAMTEFGRTFARWEDYESAAREGARFAAVHCAPTSPCASTTVVWAAVRNASTDFSSNPDYGPNPPGACGPTTTTDSCGFAVNPLKCTAGQPVNVSWTQKFEESVPFLGTYSKSFVIRGVFRCE